VEPSKEAMGFPSIPSLVSVSQTAPGNLIMPVLDYDWGKGFDYNDTSGVPSLQPPPIKRALRMLVPRVDADGNELGGVPVVLRDAPLEPISAGTSPRAERVPSTRPRSAITPAG